MMSWPVVSQAHKANYALEKPRHPGFASTSVIEPCGWAGSILAPGTLHDHEYIVLPSSRAAFLILLL